MELATNALRARDSGRWCHFLNELQGDDECFGFSYIYMFS